MENSKCTNVSGLPNQSPLNDWSENKNSVKKFNFANVFRPIYYFMRAFGYMPFTIVYDSIGEIRQSSVTTLDILWLLISLCVHLLIIYLDTMWNDSTNHISTLDVLLNQMFIIIEAIVCLIAIIMDLCNRFKFIDILRKFGQFDKEVN